jgi:hypothetical protein
MEGKVHGCPARQTVAQVFGHLSEVERRSCWRRAKCSRTELQYEPCAGCRRCWAVERRPHCHGPGTSSLLPRCAKVQKGVGPGRGVRCDRHVGPSGAGQARPGLLPPGRPTGWGCRRKRALPSKMRTAAYGRRPVRACLRWG